MPGPDTLFGSWQPHKKTASVERRTFQWPDDFLSFDARGAGTKSSPEGDAGKDGPLWCPATFRGDHRKEENVEAVHALVLDFDGGVTYDAVAGQLELMGDPERVLHTSYNHGDPAKGECFRVILPLASPVDGATYRRLWRRWAERFEHAFDRACCDPCRAFYLPSCPLETPLEPRADHVPGDLLDVSAELEGWEDPEPEPVTPAAVPLPAAETHDDAVEAYYRSRIAKVLARAVPKPSGQGADASKSRTLVWLSATGQLLRGGLSSEGVLAVVDDVCRRQGIETDPRDPRRVAYARGVENQIKRRDAGRAVKAGGDLAPWARDQVERWLQWRRLFGPILPVGHTSGSLVLYRQRRIEIPIPQSTQETRLGVALGARWPGAIREMGATWTVNKETGERERGPVNERTARTAMGHLLGQVCADPIPDGELGDGVHVLRSTTGDARGEKTVAVTAEGTFLLRDGLWRRLAVPIVGEHFASPSGRVHGPPPLFGLDAVADAYRRLVALFERWTFEQGGIPEYLASFVLALPLIPALPSAAPWVWIAGPTKSGKTELCKTLLDLSCHAVKMGNATSYALMQEVGNKAAACVVDDFEGDQTARLRDRLFDAYRSGYMLRGTIRDVKVERTQLLGPLIYSGIGASDQDQDLNRFWQIRMAKAERHIAPRGGQEDAISALAAVTSWGLSSHAVVFLGRYEATRKAAEDAGVDARLARNLLPSAMLLHMLGEPWAWLLDPETAASGACSELAEEGTVEERLVRYILDLPIELREGSSTCYTSVREHMSRNSGDLPQRLGRWDSERRLLLLSTAALTRLFPGRSDYAGWSAKRLAAVLKAHPWHVKGEHRLSSRARALALCPPVGALGPEVVRDESGRPVDTGESDYGFAQDQDIPF